MTFDTRSLRGVLGILAAFGALSLHFGCSALEPSRSPSAVAKQPEPPRTVYAIQLSPPEQSRLRAAMSEGVLVVRLGATLEPLYGCKVQLGYVYHPSYVETSTEKFAGADLTAMLPFATPAVATGDEVTVSTKLVGSYEAGRALEDGDWFEGSCEGATHYVAAVTVGAFDATTKHAPASPIAAASAAAAVAPSVGSAARPAAPSAPSPDVALVGGAMDACVLVPPNEKPPSGCDAPVRLELRRLPHLPCPRFAVPRDGVCRSDAEGVAPPGREPFQVSQQGSSPPGLAPGQVEQFVRPREKDVAHACWDGKYPGWEIGYVQFAVSVDPSGRSVPFDRNGAGSGLTAELRHEGTGGATASSAELGKCAEALVNTWRFPSATMPTWLLLNFQFHR